MKFSRPLASVLWIAMLGAAGRLTAQTPAPTPPSAAAPVGGAMIQFDNREYNFGKAPAGEFVKHTYVVTNTGTEPLDISNVHPGCGCTTAGEWTHQIAPGQTGLIPIQFNSSHYSGNVTKTIDVTSNAKNEPRANLVLRGTVWKPVEVVPQSAVISVSSDATNAASTSVRVKIQADSVVTLSDVTSSSKAFSAELKMVTPGKEYELVVTAKPPFTPGNAPATITFKTSLTNVPSVNVTAIASVQPAVQISPGQIMLAASVDRWMTNRVFIRGNGNYALTLEDPEASDSRLQVKVLPMGPRGMYNLLVAVPPNFEIPRGQHVQVTIKTNHPHYPLITIPISQLAKGRTAASGQYAIPPLVKQTATNAASQPHH